ncbi:hypothetical protein HOD96_01890 [Candidatus Falkowbacteria bacterium]|jgi:hypothetical protein|nr:hypothetical protein [Candidatus Falkowbacteria bacterium]MBT4433369.1 hypothetical protein [Candidatus Falkowbacteria bacterium]
MNEQLPKKTKTIEIFLIVLGIGALILGFLRLNNTIVGTVKNNQSNSTDTLNEQEQDLKKLIELQNKDTDQDGLSDYDELNVYHTSVYIADSDSDGFSDKEEIDAGENPHCPRGQDCSLPDEPEIEDEKPSTAFDDMEVIDEQFKNIGLDPKTGQPINQQTDKQQRLMSGNATLSEVKEMLLESGMTQQDLEKIPDSDIMKMYVEMVNGS